MDCSRTLYFNCLKVTATRKLRPPGAAGSESNGGRYFQNPTVNSQSLTEANPKFFY